MKFVFICPEKNKTFESMDFKVIENRGIITDKTGSRQLDAKVELASSCPHCGKRHIFHVNELTCPFS